MKKVSKDKKYYYPLTKKTVGKIFKQIIDPIEMGQSVTFRVGKKFGGAMTLLRFIIAELDDLAERYRSSLRSDKCVFMIIDNDDLSDPTKTGYMSLINVRLDEALGRKFDQDTHFSYAKLLDSAQKKMKELMKTKIVILVIRGIGFINFDDDFFWGNITSLDPGEKGYAHSLRFLFVAYKDAPAQIEDEKFRRIHHLLVQNIIDYNSITEEDVSYLISKWEYVLEHKFTIPEKRAIKKVSRSFPYIIKYACFALANIPKGVNPVSYLESNVLIRDLISVIDAENRLEINSKNGDIRVGGASMVYAFSPMEYNVMMLLSDNSGKVVTKDAIAQVMWPGEKIESYSEWAITQLIKRLRRKLTSLGLTEDPIETVHGRGYLLKQGA